jgi:hypothetical protein
MTSHRWTYPDAPRRRPRSGWLLALWAWAAFVGVCELAGARVGIAPLLVALAFAVEAVRAR